MRQRILGFLQLENFSKSASLYMVLSLLNGVINYAFIWLSSIYLASSDFVEFHQWIANVSVIFLPGLLTFNYGAINSRRKLQNIEIVLALFFAIIFCLINDHIFPTDTPVLFLVASALGNALYGYLSGRCFAEGRLFAVSFIQLVASLTKLLIPLIWGRATVFHYEYAYLGQMLILAFLISVLYSRTRLESILSSRKNQGHSILHPTLLSISQYTLPNVALLLLGAVRFEMPWSASILLLYLRGGSFVMILFGQLSLSSSLTWSRRSSWSGVSFSLLLYGACFLAFMFHMFATGKFEASHAGSWCSVFFAQVCFGASQLYLFKKDYFRFGLLTFLGIAGLIALALS